MKHNLTVFKSYFLKTLFELIFSIVIFLWKGLIGFRQLINWESWNIADITFDDLIDLKKDNVRVFCEVHDVHYECAGIPTQFYLYVLVVAVVLEMVYVLVTMFTMAYLLCPCGGELAGFMRRYRNKLRSAAKMDSGDTSSETLLGELHEIYYNDRDLRLLLDLLAKSSGLAPPLRQGKIEIN